jgi:hypothetical protein
MRALLAPSCPTQSLPAERCTRECLLPFSWQALSRNIMRQTSAHTTPLRRFLYLRSTNRARGEFAVFGIHGYRGKEGETRLLDNDMVPTRGSRGGSESPWHDHSLLHPTPLTAERIRNTRCPSAFVRDCTVCARSPPGNTASCACLAAQ